MVILHLTHPVHGKVASLEVINGRNEEQIKQTWRYKYGNKYLECTIAAETDCDPFIKPVFDISTGITYRSMIKASNATGFSHHTVSNHCHGILLQKNMHKRRFMLLEDVK